MSVGIAIFAIIMVCFAPVINYFCGWFVGWLTQWLIGDWVVQGLSFLHINIAWNDIPMLFGIFTIFIGFIGQAIQLGNAHIRKD